LRRYEGPEGPHRVTVDLIPKCPPPASSELLPSLMMPITGACLAIKVFRTFWGRGARYTITAAHASQQRNLTRAVPWRHLQTGQCQRRVTYLVMQRIAAQRKSAARQRPVGPLQSVCCVFAAFRGGSPRFTRLSNGSSISGQSTRLAMLKAFLVVVCPARALLTGESAARTVKAGKRVFRTG